jgi:hypothetical protein
MAQHTSWARQTSARQQGLLHTECPRTRSLEIYLSTGGQRRFRWMCALAANNGTSQPLSRETPPLQGRGNASCLDETNVFTNGGGGQGVRPRTALNKCHTAIRRTQIVVERHGACVSSPWFSAGPCTLVRSKCYKWTYLRTAYRCCSSSRITGGAR